MSILNQKLKDLTPYEPLKGQYKIRFDANESFISMPENLREKLSKIAYDLPYNRYPDPLAENVCRAFGDYFNVEEKYITAGNGSDELISIIINCFTDKDDKVICFAPDFSMYRFYSFLADLKTIELPKDEMLNIEVDKLIKIINKEKPRIIIFSNPCNPTGQGLKKEEIKKIINCFDGLLVLDEAYMDFWNESLINEFKKYKNLIILKTCSKAFGLAALRLGFAITSKELTNALRAAKSPFNVNELTQRMGQCILKEKKYLDFCVESIKNNTKMLYNGVKEIEKKNSELFVFNTFTNFVLIKTNNAVKIYEELLKKGIAVRCFNNLLRITAGSKEENQEFLKEFEKIMRNN